MKLNVRRVKALIKFMRSLPKSAEKKFNMAWWFVHNDYEHSHKVGKFITKETLEHCGTTACALGWAATIPSLRKAGLRVEALSHSDKPMKRARRVFGLDEAQAEALFAPDFDVPTTPKAWARRADNLLRKWSA